MTALQIPLNDAEPGWQTFIGTVRVRVHPLGSVQLQISQPHGDGSSDVVTLLLEGALRDVRNVAGVGTFPTYGGTVPEPFVSTADRDAAAVLAGQQRVAIRTGGAIQPPLDGSTTKADGFR